MTTNTNEMDQAAYVAAAPSTAADTMPTLPSSAITKDDGSPEEINMDVTVSDQPTTNQELMPENVYVYANSINPVSYMGDSTIVSFDVVFTVSCTDPNTQSTCTYQVVKRIGVDKMKMANNAKLTTPISIVEAKQPAPKEPAVMSKERLKALSGLK